MPEQDETDRQAQSGEQAPDIGAQDTPNQPDQGEPADLLLLSATNPVAQPDEAQPSQTEPDAAQPAPAEMDDAEPIQDEPLPPIKEPRRLSRAERETIDRQQRRFAACGRCGYLLADCRVYLGEEALQTAMLASRDGWLRLEGDETFRRLLANAYGVALDIDHEYFDGICPDCRRRYVLARQDDGPARLKLHN